MNIPLDRLYHYIESLAEKVYGDHVIIYRFWPHGSKNIQDLTPLHKYNQHLDPWCFIPLHPIIWCHDQEPLNHEFYKTNIFQPDDSELSLAWMTTLHSIGESPPAIKNLNHRRTIFEKSLLLHSESRSQDVEKYLNDGEMIPVYYWSHALIARDWFRYAQHENFEGGSEKTFLIYNRAWSGTREYRLKFADLLIDNLLVHHCQTNLNPIEPEIDVHYTKHIFKNNNWKPHNTLEDFFKPTNFPASGSADFDSDDYRRTDIEVVLETLFDDKRLQLTEKILRPIACGQPFILAGTQGSLEYLKGYGFKTFDTVWDETYDTMTDSTKRLKAIVQVMRDIAASSPESRSDMLARAREIADYNRKWFFSQGFFDLIVGELEQNLFKAFAELKRCDNYLPWMTRWQRIINRQEVIDFFANMKEMLDNAPSLPNKSRVMLALEIVRAKLVSGS